MILQRRSSPISALHAAQQFCLLLLKLFLIHTCFLGSLSCHPVNLQLGYFSYIFKTIPMPMSFQEWPHAISRGYSLVDRFQFHRQLSYLGFDLCYHKALICVTQKSNSMIFKLFFILPSLSFRESFLFGGFQKSRPSPGSLILAA